eukprot:Selendium_serpulae@DN3588_c0_g1_i1.p1
MCLTGDPPFRLSPPLFSDRLLFICPLLALTDCRGRRLFIDASIHRLPLSHSANNMGRLIRILSLGEVSPPSLPLSNTPPHCSAVSVARPTARPSSVVRRPSRIVAAPLVLLCWDGAFCRSGQLKCKTWSST